MRRVGRTLAVLAACGLGSLGAVTVPPAIAQEKMQMVQSPSDLKKFNVTVRRFDPTKGFASGTDFVLLVDNPDEEHAVSAAMSNAVAFTRKMEGSTALPVAFACVGIAAR